MGSQAGDGDDAGERHLNDWEGGTLDPTAFTEQSIGEQDDELLQGMAEDENTLSPASKKLLEKCAVSMPLPSNQPPMKTGSSVIARPPKTELNFAGFNFAKPIHPTSNFSCASRTTASSEVPKTAPGEKDKDVTGEKFRGDNNEQPSISSDKLGTQNSGRSSSELPTATPGPPGNPPSQPSSTMPTTDSSQKVGIGIPAEGLQKKTTAVSISEKTKMQERQPRAGSEDHVEDHVVTNRRAGNGSSTSSRVREKNPKGNQTDETTPRKRKENPGPLDVRSSAAHPSKVVKRQSKEKGKLPQSARGKGPTIEQTSSEPSEEDLFYLLIHRLRQREDSEAASAALREQMETQIHEMARTNEDLQAQLEQAHHKSQNQEAEIGSHRGLIDRWKAKFGKLRAFITGIGNDYECLRREGQAIKSTQQILTGERKVINDSLKHLYETTDRIEQQWGKHRAQFAEISNDLSSLQQSLSIAQGKVTDGQRLLIQEKRRVSMLENFIRDHSIKHQKQATMIQRQQAETSSKLDRFFEHVQKTWDSSNGALKSEFQPALFECLKLVRLLGDRDSIKPSDLNTVHDTISALSGRLASHITQSTTDVERVLKSQTDHSSQFTNHFEKIGDILNTNASTTEHLVQTRELNGRLEEKLKRVEETLARATTDCSRYMATEKHLEQRVSDLEAELTTAREQLMKPPVDSLQFKEEHERASQLQTQLDETSVTLAEAKEALRSKENDICELQQSLCGTKVSLEDAMCRTSELETEKVELQEQIRNVEYKVREELSRASLASRDQNRAWFEQQIHKLKHEKVTAENSAARLQEQLAIAQQSLDRAEQSKFAMVEEQEKKVVTLSGRIKELEEINISSSKMEAENENLKELQTTHLAERMMFEQQIEAAQSENERFRAEIRELQGIQAACESTDMLQEKISLLEDQISRKDHEFAELKGSFEAVSSKAEMVSVLENNLEKKTKEISAITEKAEEANKRCAEATDNSQKMADDSAMLRKELASIEHNKADLSVIKTKLDHKEQESNALQSRVQEMEHWSRRAEDFLHKVKILDTKESIIENWDLLEERLGNIFSSQQYQSEMGSNRQAVSSKETPKHHKGSKASKPSKFPENKEHEGFVRESHSQEVVYLSHKRRESASLSPPTLPANKEDNAASLKHRTCSTSSIKPFSQVQSDVLTQVPPSSPDVSLSDLSSMFPSTPCRDTAPSGSQASRPPFSQATQKLRSRRDSTADVGEKTAANAAKPRKSSREGKLEGTLNRNNKEKREPDSSGHTPAGLKRKALNLNVTDGTPLGAPASLYSYSRHVAESPNGSKVRSPGNTALTKQPAESPPFTPSQKPCRNLVPKGILKDTTSARVDFQTQGLKSPGTLLDGKGGKTKTLRKTSSNQRPGTTSEYFSHASSSKPSATGGGILGANQSPAVTYASREKRRRSSRGNRYNDRFSQAVTFAE